MKFTLLLFPIINLACGYITVFLPKYGPVFFSIRLKSKFYEINIDINYLKIPVSLFPTSVMCLSYKAKIFCCNSSGDYVIVDPIEEGEKVKAEINFILYKDHIQFLQKQQCW